MQLAWRHGKVPCSLNPWGSIPIDLNLFPFVISISCREASPLKVKYTLDRKKLKRVNFGVCESLPLRASSKPDPGHTHPQNGAIRFERSCVITGGVGGSTAFEITERNIVRF